MRSPIIDRYINGEIGDEDIDIMVAEWHNEGYDNEMPLHEYLGFHIDDYSKWVMDQSWLSELKKEHETKQEEK